VKTKDTLEIILVEDNKNDAKLLIMELSKHYRLIEHQVERREDFIEALNSYNADVILSDYSLPQFDGMLALLLRQKLAPEIPFILVTGSLNEEIAVEVMKSGADDYILKENFNRLGPAIQAALEKGKILQAKKNAEKALKENEEKYRVIVNNIPSVVLIHTENKILYANPAAFKVFGADSVDQILEMDIPGVLHPTDKQDTIEKIQRSYPTGITSNFVERKLVKFNGEVIFTEIISVPIQYFGRDAVQTIIRDISEQKCNEEKLRTLIRAVEQNPISIVITNSDGFIEYVNPKFTEITGYSYEEVFGKNPNILKSGNKPKEEYETLWDTILAGKTWYGEFYNKKKNGELYWESASISPIVNDQGEITNFVAVKEDITEKKKILEELTLAKEKAEQSDKLKSEFLAQISHEIRSPMNAILSFTNLVKEELGDQLRPEIIEYFNGIDTAGKRLIRTVDLILNASVMKAGVYQPIWGEVDLVHDILEHIQAEYSAFAKQKGLEFSFVNNLSNTIVYCDKYSINQIFANLIDNAIKFTEKGKIEITLSKGIHDNIEVVIHDSGIGISESFLKHIFEHFTQEDHGFSRRFDGSGLGLLLVKKYCDINNIIITVESEKNKGSKFILNFPAVTESSRFVLKKQKK
jgi:PAS domain S-box-containing protein